MKVNCIAPSRSCDDNTKCVKVTQLCDKVKNCQDGSDEGGKCSKLRKLVMERLSRFLFVMLTHKNAVFVSDDNQCSKAQCSHHCRNSPDGAVCYCPPGKYLAANKTTCVDEHPCDVWGTCSQKCVRYNTRHYCLCYSGYYMKEDGVTCESSSKPNTNPLNCRIFL